MRVTILPYANILTTAHRVMVSMKAKGCIVTSEMFLYFTTKIYMSMQL